MTISRRDLLVLSAAMAGLPSARVLGQSSYPDRTIRLIVPRPAGGIVDIVAREWSEKVNRTLGATYVDNVGGAGGTIGATAASRAAPDGYTLFLGTTSELVISPLQAKQSYDPIAGFDPIAILCDSAAVFVVNPKVPARTLAELVAYAHKNPKSTDYASAGAGTVSNLAGELFKRLAGLPEITHIPYKGGSPAITDLVGGQVPIATPMMSEQIIELHRHGKLRIVAVASAQRLAAVPDIPTAAEQGYPDLLARLFVGLFAPAGTPQSILMKIGQATQAAMQDRALQKSFDAAGFTTLASSDPRSAADYINKEIVRWKPVLEELGTRR